jgi:YegS/Rv2252/BmrU family lipid kinase
VDPGKKIFVVVNPNSANRRTGREWPEISRAIKEVIGDFEVLKTRAPGEATRITREALKSGFRMIVSVGGDGTHNEVVNGFFNLEGGKPVPANPDAVLAVVTKGTGGDFRKSLKIGKDIEPAIQVLKNGKDRLIDAGMLTLTNHQNEKVTRFFINIASFGIGGEVDDRVNRQTKVLGGKLSFLRGAAVATILYKNKHVRISIDGEKKWEGRVYNAAVANGQYFGGGMWVAPEAKLDDGLFDIVVMGDMSFGEILAGGTKIYQGKHLEHPKVQVFRGRVAEAVSEEKVLLDVDGEQPGRIPSVFSIIPKSIRIRMPE